MLTTYCNLSPLSCFKKIQIEQKLLYLGMKPAIRTHINRAEEKATRTTKKEAKVPDLFSTQKGNIVIDKDIPSSM